MIDSNELEDQIAREPIAAGSTQAMGGNATCGSNFSRRAPLRERLQKRVQQHVEEKRKVYQCSELCDLLDKNPDVARILDLLEEVAI